MADPQLTDQERKHKLSELLNQTHREIQYIRKQDISWKEWADEIGLTSTISMSQYRTGARLPEGRNLTVLAHWFFKVMNFDFYNYLGFPFGGRGDPRLDFIYDALGKADADMIKKVMDILIESEKPKNVS